MQAVKTIGLDIAKSIFRCMAQRLGIQTPAERMR